MSRFKISIDELVLRGFDPPERKALVEALETELRAALSDPSASHASSSRRVPSLRLPQSTFDGGARAARKLGGDIARGIVKGLDK
jgi:hypothetical protein